MPHQQSRSSAPMDGLNKISPDVGSSESEPPHRPPHAERCPPHLVLTDRMALAAGWPSTTQPKGFEQRQRRSRRLTWRPKRGALRRVTCPNSAPCAHSRCATRGQIDDASAGRVGQRAMARCWPHCMASAGHSENELLELVLRALHPTSALKTHAYCTCMVSRMPCIWCYTCGATQVALSRAMMHACSAGRRLSRPRA
jgi:hypothetical protein